MRIAIENLEGVETYTPKLTPQEQVDAAHLSYLQARIRRLELACLAAQMYCGQGDACAAYGILCQALTSL